MTTRRGFISMAGGAALAADLRAETSQERGRKIIDQTIHALGGDGFRYMMTRSEVGRAYSFYREEINGLSTAHIYTKYLPPEEPSGIRQTQRQSFGKKEDAWVLLNGKEAWDVTYRGARPLPEERVEQFRLTTLHDVFYILRIRMDEKGMAFEAKGRDVVENQPVEVVDIIDPENRATTVYIHSSTLLPVKQTFRRWDDLIKARREEVTRFTKYREAGNGVMWPFDVQRERDREKIFELYAEKVTIGEDLSPALFQLPAGIKILGKKK